MCLYLYIKNNYTCIIHLWLGVPQCFSSIILYSSGLKLQLPLKSVTEEFNVAKVLQHLMLRDSKDEMVQTAGVEIIPGREWSARKPSLKLSPNGDIERKWKEWQLGRRDFMSHQQDK